MESARSLLALRMGSLYLRARWFWGVGFLLVPVALLLNGESGSSWLVAVAGLVTLTHAYAMRARGGEGVMSAVIVDIVATHGAVLLLSVEGDTVTAPVLTGVGFTLLIMMFTHGRPQMTALALNAGFTVATVGIVSGWQVQRMFGPLLGGGGLAALIVFVIVAYNDRVADLEMARAVTLGIASHELRNRLTGVIGVTQLLAEGKVDPESGLELLELAHREAVEAGSVVEDLLTASRTERGIVATNSEPVDLAGMVRETVAAFESHRGTVKVEGADDPVRVLADPLRAPQVLRNLLTNAVRYGGPDIRVEVERDGTGVSVLVSDDGPGVHESDLPELFTPYHRSRLGQITPGSTGLGLWISRNLMRSMGGDLVYRRDDGRTVFEAVFAAAPEAAES